MEEKTESADGNGSHNAQMVHGSQDTLLLSKEEMAGWMSS